MNIKKLIIILFATILLFVGCKQFEPDMCHVFVGYSDKCTYNLDKEYVPKYTFVKLQVFPDRGYEVNRITAGYDAKCFKSEDEDNTFFILVNSSSLEINIHIAEKKTNSVYIDGNLKNCSIDVSEGLSYYNYQKYEGETVTFRITPNRYYYYNLSSLKVYKGAHKWNIEDGKDTIVLTQSIINPNEFSFVMPDTDVTITVDTKFGLSVKSQEESYKVGDKIIFDIENNMSTYETFDIIISENYADKNSSDYINIADNINLSEKYELPENVLEVNDSGCFTLYISPHGQFSRYSDTLTAKALFIVNLDTTPEGWTTIGLKESHHIYSYGALWVNVYLSPDKELDSNTRINFKYSFQNDDPSKTVENSELHFPNDSFNFSKSFNNVDVSSFDTFTFWVEDENLKYISKKITINLKNQNN